MQGIENLSDIAKLDLRYTLVCGAANSRWKWSQQVLSSVKDGLLSISIPIAALKG